MRLGWDRERIRSLRYAAPLHDVGKVKVRREVLGKPGPLTLDEVAEIRRHPRAGAELVTPLRSAGTRSRTCSSTTSAGTGAAIRPGLKGRSIPLEARILSVADAFDAMISPRPYRRPLSHDHAIDEIVRCAGTQFDPVIAELFVDAWAEGWDTWGVA